MRLFPVVARVGRDSQAPITPAGSAARLCVMPSSSNDCSIAFSGLQR
jgi:hypothetical protein